MLDWVFSNDYEHGQWMIKDAGTSRHEENNLWQLGFARPFVDPNNLPLLTDKLKVHVWIYESHATTWRHRADIFGTNAKIRKSVTVDRVKAKTGAQIYARALSWHSDLVKSIDMLVTRRALVGMLEEQHNQQKLTYISPGTFKTRWRLTKLKDLARERCKSQRKKSQIIRWGRKWSKPNRISMAISKVKQLIRTENLKG